MEESQSQFTGRIVLERVRGARPIRSFITKKITGWLTSHGIGATEQPVYEVALNRQGKGHLFTCRIRVLTRGSLWEAMVTETDLHQAILSALHHLTLQKRIERSLYEVAPA